METIAKTSAQAKGSLTSRILLCFFPTSYFDNQNDLKEWQEVHRKEYRIFLRFSTIFIWVVCLSLHMFLDRKIYSQTAYINSVFLRLTVCLIALLVLFYSYSNHYKHSRYYKVPIIFLTIYIAVYQVIFSTLFNETIPIFYLYLVPFIMTWVCQLSPGASALMLASILIPISIVIVNWHPADSSYFYHAVSLTTLSVPMLFLMRLEMLNKIKFFLMNKKYLEETRLRFEETKLRYKELGDLAAQVAHDIRSPLSAIMVLAKDNPNIPEDSRVLFRTGVTRILDITNELLNKARVFLSSTNKEEVVSEQAEKNAVHLVTDIVDNIVSEKRVEFRSKLGVNIQTNFSQNSFGLFANIQKSELKRILSNLINNSVEAVKNKGRIEISAELVSDAITIIVQDNGCGIPADVLPKLLKRGASFNKDEGNLGVGLYHAKTKLNAWGGDIVISSEVGSGTKVTITLPACVSPKWFATTLNIQPNSQVVVLDDDLAIHQVWDKRFLSLNLNQMGVEVLHLSTVHQFEMIHKNISNDVVYLIDYELLGQPKDGVEIIRDFNIQDKAILVTSRSEEQGLINKCINLNIKILPKISADLVPIIAK
jgi:signal transduction histidine kinase